MRIPPVLAPFAAALTALGQDAETTTAQLAVACDWCGQVHPVEAICASRPAARGMSRRSFLSMVGAAAGGAAVARLPLPAPSVAGRLTYRGIPVVANADVPLNAVYLFKSIYVPAIKKDLESNWVGTAMALVNADLEPGVTTVVRLPRARNNW